MSFEKDQIVSIKYGTHHNPRQAHHTVPSVRKGKFERMSAGDEFAIIRINFLPWPYTHLHVRLEDLDA